MASIAGSDPLPIRPVTTRGRIVFLFRLQERYPQLKQPGWIESYFQGFGHKKSFTLRGCDVELGKVWKGQACNGVRRRESSRGQMKLTLVCGTFPVRFILTDAVSSDQEQPVHVVCKLNSAPKIKLELDSIIKLCNVEVRRAWVKSDQTQPEGHLVANLVPIELAVDFATAKRRRGQVEWLGISEWEWVAEQHGLALCHVFISFALGRANHGLRR